MTDRMFRYSYDNGKQTGLIMASDEGDALDILLEVFSNLDTRLLNIWPVKRTERFGDIDDPKVFKVVAE